LPIVATPHGSDKNATFDMYVADDIVQFVLQLPTGQIKMQLVERDIIVVRVDDRCNSPRVR